VLLLTTAFPNRKIEPGVYYELLKDLKDEPFLKAVVDVCKTQRELFPDSNLLAILREKTAELSRVQIQLGLPQGERWGKPTKEWSELVKKISDGKSVV
jgi:hypothetical protein